MNQDFQLWLGDCLEVMPRLSDKFFHAIIVDLPYEQTNCAWDTMIPLEPMWTQFKRLIKPNGAIVLFGSQPFTSLLITSNTAWFRYCWVWEKQQPTGFLDARRKPLKAHEDIAVFYQQQCTYNPQDLIAVSVRSDRKNKAGNGVYGEVRSQQYIQEEGNFPRSILAIDRVTHNQIHQTQKPVALLKYLICTYTNPGEIVLDCCFGSGTCGVACMETGRKFVGIEKDSHYFNVGLKRITDASRAANGQPKQLTGQPSDYSDLALFAEVA